MERLDAGQPASLVDLFIDRAVTLLYFPLVYLAGIAPREWFAGPIGWLPCAVNSMLWASLIVAAGDWWRQHLGRPASANDTTPSACASSSTE